MALPVRYLLIARPGVPLVLALMGGLILGSSFSDPCSSLWFFGWAFLLFVLPFSIFLFPSLSLWAGSAFFLLTGIGLVTFFSPRINTPQVPAFLLNPSEQHLSGVIIEEPLYYPDRTRLIVRLTSFLDHNHEHPVGGIILVGIRERLKSFDQGDPVRLVCRLHPIEGYHNPGGYDFEKRMAEKGIRVSGFIKDPGNLVLSGPNQRLWPWHRLGVIRKRVSNLIDSELSSPVNSLAQALLTGDQSKIPHEIQQTFSQAGVSHLLAFSGLNLSLVGGLTFFLLRFLLSFSEKTLLYLNVRKWALIGSFFPILGYALLAGLSPSALRALFMVWMVITAFLLNKYSDLLNTLSLAALIILLLSPGSLFLPSFQLSFLAVWAIGYLLPRIWSPHFNLGGSGSRPTFRIRGGYYLWGTFCVSLVCQLATAPVVAFWFHQISLVGLLSNLILVPLAGVITPIGLSALIFSPLSFPLSSALFGLMGLLLQGVLWLTKFLAGLPAAFMTVPRPGFLEIGFFYLTLIFLFNFKKIPRAAWLISFSLAGTAFFFFYPQIKSLFFSPLSITFLDVGHGNSILIRFPDGQKMLIDGGGSTNSEFDIGERVVAPFLWGKKITGLDVVVLTHPHPDHLNGLPFILSKFKVKEIWLNGQSVDTQSYRQFEEVIRQKKIPVIYPKTGWSRFFSAARVEVLRARAEPSPNKGAPSATWHSQNNDSLVLLLSFQNQQVLLPADIEAQAETSLLDKRSSMQSQILQVPHHGSLSSSTYPFLEAVKPKFAVISGRSSARFPLPHPKVIRRYQETGATLFRTDQNGAVTFELKPGGWEVTDYKGVYLNTH
jgi:competence protein ComEC